MFSILPSRGMKFSIITFSRAALGLASNKLGSFNCDVENTQSKNCWKVIDFIKFIFLLRAAYIMIETSFIQTQDSLSTIFASLKSRQSAVYEMKGYPVFLLKSQQFKNIAFNAVFVFCIFVSICFEPLLVPCLVVFGLFQADLPAGFLPFAGAFVFRWKLPWT